MAAVDSLKAAVDSIGVVELEGTNLRTDWPQVLQMVVAVTVPLDLELVSKRSALAAVLLAAAL